MPFRGHVHDYSPVHLASLESTASSIHRFLLIKPDPADLACYQTWPVVTMSARPCPRSKHGQAREEHKLCSARV
jgi:hypothetical protein